jgi:hypothetical protein
MCPLHLVRALRLARKVVKAAAIDASVRNNW